MARLFAANPTRFRSILMFRLDFNRDGIVDGIYKMKAPLQCVIEPGAQVQVGGDMHANQIQSIMDQLTPTGAIGIEQLSRLPNHKISTILSVDKAISPAAIREVFDHNRDLLMNQGKERRQKAAIAANNMIDAAAEAGQVKAFDLEIERVDDGGEQLPKGSMEGEGFRVRKEKADKPSRRSGGRRR